MDYCCPQCKSLDVEVGLFVLRCLACGWDHNNKHPCDICGKPSFGSAGAGGQNFYGCKEHPAFKKMLDMVKEKREMAL